MSYYRYTRLQQYINGQPTDTYTKGERVDNVEYSTYGTCMGSSGNSRWVSIPQTVCYNGDLWSMEKEQISYDGGQTWVDTTNTRRAAVIEPSASQCSGADNDWRVVYGEYICNGTTKCLKEAEYIDNSPTGRTRAGSMVELLSEDCGVMYQWVNVPGEYVCVYKCGRADKYTKQKQQYSLDNGVHWEDTGETREGDFVEKNSADCGCDTSIPRWITVSGEYVCVGTSKYTKEKEQTSTDGTNWTDTGNTRAGSLIEANSTDCGYTPPSTTRWVADTGYVCVGTDKYNKEKEQISYDSGSTWTDTGNTKAGSTLIEANSEDCGYSPTPQYEIAPLHYIENDVLKPIANSSAILNNNVITLHVEGLIPEVIEAGATYVIYVSTVSSVENGGRYLTINGQEAQNQNPVTNETITINSFSNVKGGEWIRFVKMIKASPQYGPGMTGESCVIPIIFYLHLGENISDTYLSDVYISPEKTTEVELRLSPSMFDAEDMYLFNDALGRDNTIYTITLDLIPTENNGGVYYYPSMSQAGTPHFMTTDDFLNYLNDSSVTCQFWTETNHYPEIASVISKTSISNKLSLNIKFNKLTLDSFMKTYWDSSCRMMLWFNINDEKFVLISFLVVKNVYNNIYKKGLIGNSRYTLLSVNDIYSVDKSFNRIANTGHESDIYDETYTDRTDFTIKEIVSADDVTRKDSKTIIYNGVEFVDYMDVVIEKGINNVYDLVYYNDGDKYMLYQIISDTPQLSNSKFGLGAKIKTGGPINYYGDYDGCEIVYDGYALNNTAFSNWIRFKSANLELITYRDSNYSILRNHYYVNPLTFSNHGKIYIEYYKDYKNTRYYYAVQTQFLGKGTMQGGHAIIEV